VDYLECFVQFREDLLPNTEPGIPALEIPTTDLFFRVLLDENDLELS